jgi:hypothetical protein
MQIATAKSRGRSSLGVSGPAEWKRWTSSYAVAGPKPKGTCRNTPRDMGTYVPGIIITHYETTIVFRHTGPSNSFGLTGTSSVPEFPKKTRRLLAPPPKPASSASMRFGPILVMTLVLPASLAVVVDVAIATNGGWT